MQITKKIFVGASACLTALSLAGCDSSNNVSNKQSATVQASSFRLANLNYKSGKQAWVNVHHDKSTLNPKSWKRNHVVYSNLDRENRTSKGCTYTEIMY